MVHGIDDKEEKTAKDGTTRPPKEGVNGKTEAYRN